MASKQLLRGEVTVWDRAAVVRGCEVAVRHLPLPPCILYDKKTNWMGMESMHIDVILLGFFFV